MGNNNKDPETYMRDVDNQRLCENLYGLYLSGQYCDVTLKSAVDNTEFHAHRNVLHSSNDYFKRLFTSPPTDSVSIDTNKQPVYKISGISGDILEILIMFCYGKMIEEIDDDNVYDILTAASMLRFNRIIKLCVVYLEKRKKIF